MDNRYNFMEFIIILLKCFFILVFLGVFLPKIIDWLLYNFISSDDNYKDSILVYKLINSNVKILYTYVFLFKNFIKY